MCLHDFPDRIAEQAQPLPDAGLDGLMWFTRVGGGGERRLLRLVAHYADIANVFGDPATVRHKLDVLERHCDEIGRDPVAQLIDQIGFDAARCSPAPRPTFTDATTGSRGRCPNAVLLPSPSMTRSQRGGEPPTRGAETGSFTSVQAWSFAN